MTYRIKGTRFEAANISTAVNFEIAIDRRELEILRERYSPEELAALREQAAEEVASSGRFVTVAQAGEDQ